VASVLEVKGKGNAAESVAIVANELLENAVKYGDPVSEVTARPVAPSGR
jgi:hypothetical protein